MGQGLVQKDELGMGSPLGYPGRRFGARTGFLDGEGGSAATEFAGVSVVWPLWCAKGGNL